MKNIAIMVGLPRSGKSTISEKMKEENEGSMIFSADKIRLLLYGQRFYREGEAMMWAFHDLMFKLLVEQGIDIIVDETNTMAERRQQYIKLAKANGYSVTCVWVTADAETCKRRAIITGQDDVVHVIDRMQSKFQEPVEAEGFDEIIKY